MEFNAVKWEVMHFGSTNNGETSTVNDRDLQHQCTESCYNMMSAIEIIDHHGLVQRVGSSKIRRCGLT